jgi:hypothetical protein
LRKTPSVVLLVTLSCLAFLAACAPEPKSNVPTFSPIFPAAGTSTAVAVEPTTKVPMIIATASSQAPTPTSSAATILTSRTAAAAASACRLGAGLREDTVETQLAYQSPGGLYVTGSLGLAEEYFGQLETGLRVLVGPSLARLRELADQASASGVPYDALAYSLEAGRHTPMDEQMDVVGATRQASSLAHAHGKLLLMGPGLGLMEENWAQYPTMASYADLWTIQTQRLQSNPAGPKYREEVEKIISQLRMGNADLRIWAQISVTPGGQELSTAEVLAYREAISDLVDGVYIYSGGDPNRPETLEAIFAAVCGSDR